MQKGDKVVTYHPDSNSKNFARVYGIVCEMTSGGGVVIQMSDGTLINRQFNSIAVYIQPPPNWHELFKQQVVFSPSENQMMANSSYKKKRHNGKKANPFIGYTAIHDTGYFG